MPTICPRCHTALMSDEPGCRHCGLGLPAASTLPSPWPTFLVTAVFGVFGLIPANRATRDAESEGVRTTSYWRTFGLGVIANLLIGVIIAMIWLLGLPSKLGLDHLGVHLGQAAAGAPGNTNENTTGDNAQPIFHTPAPTTASSAPFSSAPHPTRVVHHARRSSVMLPGASSSASSQSPTPQPSDSPSASDAPSNDPQTHDPQSHDPQTTAPTTTSPATSTSNPTSTTAPTSTTRTTTAPGPQLNPTAVATP